jgi:uncharacterized protein YndB with AHSA1/START domain
VELHPIIIEVEIKAPLERVWQLWTQPDELTTWLAEQANIQTDVGGAFELFWEPNHPERNSTLGCTITAMEPNKMLSFTWKGPVAFQELMNTNPPPTSVTVVLRAVSQERTAVRLEHVGWGCEENWVEARTWQERAWRTALTQLRDQTER